MTDSTPHERPWLLPYNRKIRHLQGITIRNLTITPFPSRPRTRTIDDDGLPSALRSPTKAMAQRENKKLAHSRSSSDLKKVDEASRHNNDDVPTPISPQRLQRPGAGKSLRRRSTLEWTGASPLTRQRKLEDITGSRMADTFFTLHVENQEEPVYISEVVDKAMNPNFRFFDLASCGPGVTRLDKLTVKVWARNEATKNWQYLIDFTVQLRSLQFIGRALGGFKHPLPQNCILFHMTDGIYTSFTDMPMAEKLATNDLAPPKEHPEGIDLPSSSYDALMRLNTLDDCIQDALATRDRLAEEIEEILQANHNAIGTVERVPEAQERLKTVEAAVSAEKRRVDAVRRRRDDLQATIQTRRTLIAQGQTLETQLQSSLPTSQESHKALKQTTEKLQEDITNQRRRICEDLQRIFPIDPAVPPKPLLFTIRGLTLPNSAFDDADENITAAALHHVAQIVSLLSPYLSVILPYPITLHGSTSTISDPLAIHISSTSSNPSSRDAARTYPLFMKGVVRYRFEYAVFLLNKNIEILSNALGIRPVDIRHTLPNLKYLLFVATAGKGELPARKSGGIKGLLRQEGAWSGSASRKGSMDSAVSGSDAGSGIVVPSLVGNAKAADGKGSGEGMKDGEAALGRAHVNGGLQQHMSFAKRDAVLGKHKGSGLVSATAGSRLREVE
ncbi:unnamed protein product [Periconia digitata]|uniref:Autophagy-related protein 14 n=1 Tax=Periconia digitata TaxID=1303443 RepID=A0A9W4UD47_9PLEO|nr:unnamed protein product [Periconia digitata]